MSIDMPLFSDLLMQWIVRVFKVKCHEVSTPVILARRIYPQLVHWRVIIEVVFRVTIWIVLKFKPIIALEGIGG